MRWFSDKQALRADCGALHGQIAKWAKIVRKYLHDILLKNKKKNIFSLVRKSVLLGEMDANTEMDCEIQQNFQVCNPPTQSFGIEQAITHPQYSPTSVQNDIGLIRLDRDADFSVGKTWQLLLIQKLHY